MKNEVAAKVTAQQGDVLLRRADNILSTEGKKVISVKRCILAEGEQTGHCHVIEDDGVEMFSLGDKTYIDLENESTITHEEHKPITLSKGIWEIGRVQEFDYFKMMSRQVTD